MSVAAKIAWDDTILPFRLENADVRGRVARLDRTLDQILGQHDYPAPVQALVAEAALLTALIGQMIDLRWKLSLQIRGNGPIRLIATDYFAPEEGGRAARMRAYASFDRDAVPDLSEDPFELVGSGMFGILIDQGEGTTPYQGITPLTGGSLSACAATYFAQSEQLPTDFALGSALATEPGEKPGWRAGGIMIQHMPKASLEAKGASGEGGLLSASDLLDDDDGENWNRVSILLNTTELTELLGPHVSTDELVYRLFHEEAPYVNDPQHVRFGCTCSLEKVQDTMSVYGPEDIAEMTTEDGIVTADCQFCGAHYALDPSTLGTGAAKPSA